MKLLPLIAFLVFSQAIFAQDIPGVAEFTPAIDADSYIVYEVNIDGSLTELATGTESPIDFTVPDDTNFIAIVMRSVNADGESPPGEVATWAAPIEPIIITRPPIDGPTIITICIGKEQEC